tara:strand:- start:50 stop:337 length:288 start_codon:yes stop_codon:yes gene_type:complete
MERPKSEIEENKMTVYFNQRAHDEQEKEERLAEEKKQQQEEAVKAVGRAVSFFVKPVILMLLWNWLMPGLFGLQTIGYLKAFALHVIARIIIDKE